jgi:hypothetical protein
MTYAYLVLQLCLFSLSLFGYFQVKRFLSTHNAIANPTHLDNFKTLVRMNMYGALAYMVLGVPALLLSIYFGWNYGILGIVGVTAINVLQLVFGQHLRKLEDRARHMRCSRELSGEFRTVGEVWFKKALPNF